MRKLICLILLLCSFYTGAFAELEIYFLDVGQGDAAILLCDGAAMMIDGGRSSQSQFIYSYIRNTLQLERMDYIIATHPDADHIGGLAAALNAVPVDLLLSSSLSHDTKAFSSMMKYAELQGTPVIIPQDGDVFQLGGATVTILVCWPEAPDSNDTSIVLRVDYGKTSFLFTGDAEYTLEYMLLDQGADLHADVLKVGHHGSSSSSTDEFIDAVCPQYAVISCGANNSYGHPHEAVLQTLERVGAELLRTDELGTIIFHSDGDTVRLMNAPGE